MPAQASSIGSPSTTGRLETSAEALRNTTLALFENGRFLECGRTERRHVVATGLVLEANWIGDSGEADPIVSRDKVGDT
jgi:hypothetical protein